MTRLPFDPCKGLILVTALLSGPFRVRLALDTGATMTIVRTGILVSLGYDTAAADERVRITTASGVEYVPLTARRVPVSFGRFGAVARFAT